MDFQSEKSFGKLRLRAFQPYHQVLCMSKNVEDVEGQIIFDIFDILQQVGGMYSVHTGVYTPGHTLPLADTPPDGHCSGRYASYWNAFLLWQKLTKNYSWLRLEFRFGDRCLTLKMGTS